MDAYKYGVARRIPEARIPTRTVAVKKSGIMV
jgi:hypothetical protein